MNTPIKSDATRDVVKETHQPEKMQPPTGWRQSKWLALIELAIVALIFVADAHHLIRE